MHAYVDAASWKPQTSDPNPASLGAILSPQLIAHLKAHPDDELVFTDRKSKLKATTMRVKITLHALMNPDGTASAIAAEISTRSTDGVATTRRSGEVLLRPIGKNWQIIGFQLSVNRDPGAGSKSATTTSEVTP